MYSPALWQHATNPQNRGKLPTANAHGQSDYPPCGDRFRLHLEIEHGIIVAASYEAQACGPVVAVGSCFTNLLRSRSVEEAKRLSCFDLDRLVGGLPPSKRHALLLFLDALNQALTEFDQPKERT